MPIAGRGSRFADKGYEIPKPLIEVGGQPMFAWAIQSLEGLPISRLIVVTLQEHEQLYGICDLFRQYWPHDILLDFILLPDVTEGQLCTVMAAESFFEPHQSIIIVAGDTLVKGSLAQDISAQPENSAGLISVASLPGDRWSFARTDDQGKVVLVAEKVRISDHASTGIYYFRRCDIFLSYARKILDGQEKTKGEYYVIPVYQKMINDGLWVGISETTEMWDMGTPEAKAAFENHLKQ